MSEWQPIETVPRDTSPAARVMLSNGEIVWVGRLENVWGSGEMSWDPDDRDGDWSGDPTHWMPLPEAPTPTDGKLISGIAVYDPRPEKPASENKP